MATRIYVGYRTASHPGGTGREVFKADSEPTFDSHSHLYAAVIGPFRTMRAARFVASSAAVGNPHVQTVDDAERIAKEIANRPVLCDKSRPITGHAPGCMGYC